jgi:hypothetical protein
MVFVAPTACAVAITGLLLTLGLKAAANNGYIDLPGAGPKFAKTYAEDFDLEGEDRLDETTGLVASITHQPTAKDALDLDDDEVDGGGGGGDDLI